MDYQGADSSWTCQDGYGPDDESIQVDDEETCLANTDKSFITLDGTQATIRSHYRHLYNTGDTEQDVTLVAGSKVNLKIFFKIPDGTKTTHTETVDLIKAGASTLKWGTILAASLLIFS